jgi:glutamyl-tRNA reductase
MEIYKSLGTENEESTIKHLFEVSCGYHSKIKGEDQILGQIKTAYKESLDIKGTSKVLGRLFESAIACGKKFRNEAKLYEIPVSSISIVANKFIEMNCKKIMILGFGEIGQLAVKYFLQNQFEEIYLVLRDLSKAADLKDTKIKLLTFEEK